MQDCRVLPILFSLLPCHVGEFTPLLILQQFFQAKSIYFLCYINMFLISPLVIISNAINNNELILCFCRNSFFFLIYIIHDCGTQQYWQNTAILTGNTMPNKTLDGQDNCLIVLVIYLVGGIEEILKCMHAYIGSRLIILQHPSHPQSMFSKS